MKSLLFRAKQGIAIFSLIKNLSYLDYLLFFLILSAILLRLVNLDYNSAFNDEAIYIVIGRMGLFASDWLSYGAKLWMAGLPYIYPTISALAFETAGIEGARLLNVIFGIILIEEVYQLTLLLNLFDTKTNKIAATIALFLSGFSAAGIFVSKLATYDMLSFLLLICAITSFLKARHFNNGKYYFLTFISIFTSFLTKVVAGIYFAPLFLISIFIIKNRSVKQKKLSIYYLYIPLIICMSVYGLLNSNNLLTFVTTHKDQGITTNYLTIIQIIIKTSGLSFLFLIPGSAILIKYKKTKQVLGLIVLSMVIPVFHLVLRRYATLDKHMYLSDIFLSVVIAYAVSLFFRKKIYRFLFKNRIIFIPYKIQLQKMITSFVFFILAIFYVWHSALISSQLEHQWKNTKEVGYFLSERIHPGDKLLTENGGAIILILYDKLFPPTDIVTFDWINYSGISSETAYEQAIKDGYFNYIELDNEYEENEEFMLNLREAMIENYQLIYSQNNFEIYEKKES